MSDLIWRRIVSGPLTGATNMALDEALFRSVQAGNSPPVLRLYRWQPAAVSLGYGQRGERQVNFTACAELGIDVVRRLTGGRAVLHADEVTYAVIAPESGLFSASILDNYRLIASALQHCLSTLGLPVEMVSGRHETKTDSVAEQSACFTAPSYFELTCHGLKICGSAQKREGDCFLQHGSLPVGLDPMLLFRTLNCDLAADHQQGARSLERQVGWVNRWLERPLTIDRVEAQLRESFSAVFPVRMVDDQPDSSEMALARQLAEGKYAHPDWTSKGSGN